MSTIKTRSDGRGQIISSLYIHIPFCDNICNYCDFSKVLVKCFDQTKYIQSLIQEIKSYKIEDHTLKTIYIGGGTPSVLSLENLEKLLSFLDAHFYPVDEFTFEANPESLTEDKIFLLSKYHINRVSLGVQSVSNELLKKLNRKHEPKDVKKCVMLLRKHEIQNINLDFIYGIPGSTHTDIQDDLNFIYELNPPHVSFYSLQIEEGTVFAIQKMQPYDEDKMREEYDFINDNLQQHGYERYEVSNFCKNGYESKHNKTYWKDNQYYGCGVSASGYVFDKRYTNTKSITHYLEGKTIQIQEKITEPEMEFEYLMLNLRLVEGFSLDDFKERFKKDFLISYKEEINKCKEDLIIENNTLRIRPEKIYIMDSILLNLLKEY